MPNFSNNNISINSSSYSVMFCTQFLSSFLVVFLFLSFIPTLPVGVCILIGFFSYDLLALISIFLFDTIRAILKDLNVSLHRGMNFLNKHIKNPYLKNFIAVIAAIPFFLTALTGIALFNLIKDTLFYVGKLILSLVIGVVGTLILTVGSIAYLVAPNTVMRILSAFLAREPVLNRVTAHNTNQKLIEQIKKLPSQFKSKDLAINPEVRESLMKLPDEHLDKLNLLELESLLENAAICSITWNTIKEPLTVELREGERVFYTLFEKSSLESHLSLSASFAKLPGKEVPLIYNDKNKVWKQEGNALILQVGDVPVGNRTIRRTIRIFRDLDPDLKNKLAPLIERYQKSERNYLNLSPGQNRVTFFNDPNYSNARKNEPNNLSLTDRFLAPRSKSPAM